MSVGLGAERVTNLGNSGKFRRDQQTITMSYPSYPQPDPSRHYPSHYGQPITIQHLPIHQTPLSISHRLPPPPPDFSSVTPQMASQTARRLISSQLQDAGYEAAQPQALQRLENEVATCELETLLQTQMTYI